MPGRIASFSTRPRYGTGTISEWRAVTTPTNSTSCATDFISGCATGRFTATVGSGPTGCGSAASHATSGSRTVGSRRNRFSIEHLHRVVLGGLDELGVETTE